MGTLDTDPGVLSEMIDGVDFYGLRDEVLYSILAQRYNQALMYVREAKLHCRANAINCEPEQAISNFRRLHWLEMALIAKD